MESLWETSSENKTYVILGCKRSGTSILAKALGEQEDIDIEVCGNGHNEDLDFVLLNDDILREAGGNWNNLPDETLIKQQTKRFGTRIRNLLKKKAKDKWGWKDPRQGATIEYFLPYMDGDIYLFCAFRKPEKVAESMFKVWGIPHERGLEIARDYNSRIIKAVKEFTNV
jgi:hypothetical protein